MSKSLCRTGHDAVLGRPNSGQSTLINALVGALVGILDSQLQALGTFSGARNGADSVQHISYVNEGAGCGQCQASGAADIPRSCIASDSLMVEAISSVGPASYIHFKWDAEGICTRVRVINGSHFLH